MLDVLKNTDVILTSEWRVWSKPINGKSFHIVQEHKIWLYEYSNLDHIEEITDIKRLQNFLRLSIYDQQADRIDAFNTVSRYLDDILNINNVYFDNMVSQIYP